MITSTRSSPKTSAHSSACVVLLALLSLSLAPAVRPAVAARRLRVLFVLAGGGGPGGAHDVEKNPPTLEAVLKRAGNVEVTEWAPPPGKQNDGAHLQRLAELKPGDFDVLVFYTVGQSLTPAQGAALQRFVESGGGLVALHGASASFGNSTAWMRLIGARFAGHAPGTYSLPIRIVDPKHPIARGVRDFTIEDEEYTQQFPEGVERHVIAQFAKRPPNTAEKHGNNDCVWTINVGKGRVVYESMGHGTAAWQNPMFQRLTAQAIFWAAGHPREVKVE